MNTSNNADAKMIRKPAASLGGMVLGKGQFGFSTDTDVLKIGDGSTTWALLPTIGSGGGGGGSFSGVAYKFNETNDPANLSTGQLCFNATLDELYIFDTDNSIYSLSQTFLIETLSAGGVVYINDAADGNTYQVFKATSCELTGSYWTIYGSANGISPADGSDVRVTIAPVEVTGVKRYVALLSQSGTDAPVATVLENALGVSWQRTAQGQYQTNDLGFSDNTFVYLPQLLTALGADEGGLAVKFNYQVTGGRVSISVGDNSSYLDDQMLNHPISITRYS